MLQIEAESAVEAYGVTEVESAAEVESTAVAESATEAEASATEADESAAGLRVLQGHMVRECRESVGSKSPARSAVEAEIL
ncbi:hypothetical protein CYMTET_53389 [Cymbomonas tetramitiformis]|uniref:Uncharacterized protein n=1 Tax=Cymbomonas tetramitiformis TaxID=36881 RepID=A0AAE0BH53_9CHLO|nr:hypothetical protein CYMTET_53389 [Cymbomonas tetramitiformis]